MTTDVDTLIQGVLQGDSRSLSRAITLTESKLPSSQSDSQRLLGELSKNRSRAHRIAITGAPGVGKSTFIEALGLKYCQAGKKVAVLAVDPSSAKTGGSILGDKTRMEKLSIHDNSFIRPTASSNSLGGVTRRTRESILLCEAAGYDYVLIEINKAEEENQLSVREAISDFKSAFHLLGDTEMGWRPTVKSISSISGRGMDDALSTIGEHWQFLSDNNRLNDLRSRQDLEWFEQELREAIVSKYLSTESQGQRIEEYRDQVAKGQMMPILAVKKVLED